MSRYIKYRPWNATRTIKELLERGKNWLFEEVRRINKNTREEEEEQKREEEKRDDESFAVAP